VSEDAVDLVPALRRLDATVGDQEVDDVTPTGRTDAALGDQEVDVQRQPADGEHDDHDHQHAGSPAIAMVHPGSTGITRNHQHTTGVT